MKLDSKPLNLSTSETESQLELKDEIDCNSTTTLVELSSPLVSDKPQKQQTPLVIFATTFVTIFLAEIGDKTQLSTLLMSAQSQSPWVVFLGSAAALITTSLLGVMLGSWIASKLSPKTIEKASGIMLLLISLMLFWDVAQF
ncbi:MAG: TMEM165/GDT1 family protein [Scytonema sp. RU_4_4]|nr:TMEM165/GDT1 family protein [Scytonema sp. RU_4_4]NJR73358.1 TMEM165/GDT1 family protein [Scytonema sp. CRU_2_7]